MLPIVKLLKNITVSLEEPNNMFNFIQFCQDYNVPYGSSGIVSKGRVGVPDITKGLGDTEFHTAWSPHTGVLYSWVSGYVPLKDYLAWIAPDVPYTKLLKEYSTDFDYVERIHIRENATSLEYNFPELGKVARKYLERRGFDVDELITKYKFRDGGFTGDFAYRVIIPIIDTDGRIVSWQGRAYAGQDLRYKTLAIEKSLVDPKKMLFNLNNCNKDYVVVTEGPMDTIKWGDGACATLGTSVTEAQVQLLTKYKKVFIIYDSEAPAQLRAKKLADRVSALGVKEVSVIDLEDPESKDLGGMTYEQVNELKKELWL